MKGTVTSFVIVLVLVASCKARCQSSLDDQLRSAAKDGDTADVQALLDRGANIEARGVLHRAECSLCPPDNAETSDTPLMLAIESVDTDSPPPAWMQHYTDTVKLLISRHANVNARDYYGHTPLMLVLRSFEIAKLLVDNGADVRAKDTEHQCPLIDDTRRSPEIMEYLINHGADADINVRCSKGNNEWALNNAAGAFCLQGNNQCLQRVQLLLDHGAQVNMSSDWAPPLYYAAQSGNLEVVRVLLEGGRSKCQG